MRRGTVISRTSFWFEERENRVTFYLDLVVDSSGQPTRLKTHLFDVHRVANDLRYSLDGQLVDQLSEQQAGEVGVQALVAADELVREAQPRHEPSLLEPEDGAETAGKENTL